MKIPLQILWTIILNHCQQIWLRQIISFTRQSKDCSYIKICHLTSIEIPITNIWQSHDCLFFILGILILMKLVLYWERALKNGICCVDCAHYLIGTEVNNIIWMFINMGVVAAVMTTICRQLRVSLWIVIIVQVIYFMFHWVSLIFLRMSNGRFD